MKPTNWKTTVTGVLCVICALAAAKPELVDALPVAAFAKLWMKELAAYVATGFGAAFAYQTKDKDMTGGRRKRSGL